MNELFQGFKYGCVYTDDILVLTTGNWTDRLTKLENVHIKLQWKDSRQGPAQDVPFSVILRYASKDIYLL